jgi:fibronectin type 3 domain-containing protein
MINNRSIVASLIGLACCGSGCSSVPGPAFGWVSNTPELVLTEHPGSDLQEPQGLVANGGELRAIPLKWEPVLVGEVGGYVIERSEAQAGPFERIATLSGRLNTHYIDANTLPPLASPAEPADDETPSMAPVNLEDGLTWSYRIRAYSESGAIATTPSAVATATTAPPPAPPEELRAYSRQPRKVALSWRASEDRLVQGYWVDRSPTAAGPYQLITNLEGRNQTNYVDVGLGDLRVFYYRVTAANQAGGLGSPSDPVQAVTKPEPLPPYQLRASETHLGRNVLSWEPNVESDIVEYRVLRARSRSDAVEIVASVSPEQTTAEDLAVGAGEAIRYSVVAIDRDGLESNPAQPIEVASVDYGLEGHVVEEGIRLSWKADRERFRGGHVFRHERFGRRSLGFTTEDHFLDPNTPPGVRHRYSVVLERPDKTLAPPSQVIEVETPEPVIGQSIQPPQ